MDTLQELWRFRSYILSSVQRDFNLRFKGSVLGAALVFLVPALQIALYVVVFGNLMKGRLPGTSGVYSYSIYLCGGILFWTFFTELLQRSQNLYLDNANLLKKAVFPSIALSVVNCASGSINLVLSMALLLIFMVVNATLPGWHWLGLLAVWFALAVLALGFGLCIAVLQVFFRDFGALTAIGLQALFWATPIVYPVEILPSWLLPWMPVNPLYAPISTAQALLLGTALPTVKVWLSTVVAGLAATLLASRLYRLNRSDLLDNL